MIPSVAACPDAAFSIPEKGIDWHFLDLQMPSNYFHMKLGFSSAGLSLQVFKYLGCHALTVSG